MIPYSLFPTYGNRNFNDYRFGRLLRINSVLEIPNRSDLSRLYFSKI